MITRYFCKKSVPRNIRVAKNVTELFRGEATTPMGETLKDFRDFDDRTLEERHDYIQHMFPSPESSAFNDKAMIVTKADTTNFRESKELREELLANLKRIIAFWEFEMIELPGQEKGQEHEDKDGDGIVGEVRTRQSRSPTKGSSPRLVTFRLRDSFLTKHGSKVILRSRCKFHNFLRLTRVIKSLYHLGLTEHAYAFQAFLLGSVAAASSASETTVNYWRTAIPVPGNDYVKIDIGGDGDEEDNSELDSAVDTRKKNRVASPITTPKMVSRTPQAKDFSSASR